MVAVMEGVHVSVRAAYKVNNEASNGEFTYMDYTSRVNVCAHYVWC